ncbi:MAG: carboxylase, partial [Muribaculaceae bacterium]|nr:carboxylase [Muribaculaceae bacterium]
MAKALKIRDLSLRDAQQTLFASRMRTESIRTILPLYRKAGFYIMEVWGGDIPEVMMKHLNESPWERLRECAEEMKGVSLLSAFSRGSALLGNTPYPNFVMEGFYKEALLNGLNVVRLFHPLNDVSDLTESVKIIKEYEGIADFALCYADNPKPEPKPIPKKKGFFARLFGNDEEPEEIAELYTDDYFIRTALKMEKAGARIITLSDSTGLMAPSKVYALMPKLKHHISVPVDFHACCSLGLGLASTLTAILKGVDI